MRLTGLLERYSQSAQSQLLVDMLVKDSKLAALEMAAQLMYGKICFPMAHKLAHFPNMAATRKTCV